MCICIQRHVFSVVTITVCAGAWSSQAQMTYVSATRTATSHSTTGVDGPSLSYTSPGPWIGSSLAPGGATFPNYPGCVTTQTSLLGDDRVVCDIVVGASSLNFGGYYFNSRGDSWLLSSFNVSEPTPFALSGSWSSGINTDVGETASGRFTVVSFGSNDLGVNILFSEFRQGIFGNHTSDSFSLSGVLQPGSYGLTNYMYAYGHTGTLHFELVVPSASTGAVLAMMIPAALRRRRASAK